MSTIDKKFKSSVISTDLSSKDPEKRFKKTLRADVSGGIAEHTVYAATERAVIAAFHDYVYATYPEYKQQYDDALAIPLAVNTIHDVKTIDVRGVSCVGIMNKSYPIGHGNYFSIMVPGVGEVGVINMWYENLIEAIKVFDPKTFTLELFNGDEGVIISSPDIPDDWFIGELFMKYNCALDNISAIKVRKYKGITF